MEPVLKNPRKEKDYGKRSQFIWVLAWFMGIPLVVIVFVSMIGGDTGPVFWLAKGGIVILVGVCIFLTIIFLSVLNRASGSYLNLLGFGGKSKRSRREQMSAEFSLIKEAKRQGRFNDALRRLEAYLERDPDYPEAWFLKAQVLWEGFGNTAKARQCLAEVLRLVPENEPLHRWALDTQRKIKEEDRGNNH